VIVDNRGSSRDSRARAKGKETLISHLDREYSASVMKDAIVGHGRLKSAYTKTSRTEISAPEADGARWRLDFGLRIDEMISHCRHHHHRHGAASELIIVQGSRCWLETCDHSELDELPIKA